MPFGNDRGQQTYASAVPFRLPPCALAVRIVFDDSDCGPCFIKLTITGTDGDRVYEKEFSHHIPTGVAHPTPGTTHQAGSLCLIFLLPEVEMRSYGAQAIDLVLGEQDVQMPFYVYPKSAEIVS